MTKIIHRVSGPRFRTISAVSLTRPRHAPGDRPSDLILAMMTEAIHGTPSLGGVVPPIQDEVSEHGVWHRWVTAPPALRVGLTLRSGAEHAAALQSIITKTEPNKTVVDKTDLL